MFWGVQIVSHDENCRLLWTHPGSTRKHESLHVCSTHFTGSLSEQIAISVPCSALNPKCAVFRQRCINAVSPQDGIWTSCSQLQYSCKPSINSFFVRFIHYHKNFALPVTGRKKTANETKLSDNDKSRIGRELCQSINEQPVQCATSLSNWWVQLTIA